MAGCIVLSILFFTSFINVGSGSCEKLKNGTFYYYTKKTRERVNVFRHNDLQIEKSVTSAGTTMRNKIVWKGNCSFDLYINAYSEQKLTAEDSLIASTPAHVKIIFIGKTYYICTANISLYDVSIKLIDTVYYQQK